MSINIREVKGKKDLKKFIQFIHDLYDGDQNYVPELQMETKTKLSKKKNPFFQHSDAAYFLAEKNGKVVGRIAAIHNTEYIRYQERNSGFFGYFDFIDDKEVSKALLDKAVEWLKTKNVDDIQGPTNLTTNDTSGLLIDGFDKPPVIELTYNFSYYVEHFDAYGLVKDMDMFAYDIPTESVNLKALKLSSLIKERLEKRGYTFRNVDPKKFDEELNRIKKVYIEAWEKNWGFVPPTSEEFDRIAKTFKQIYDPRYVYMAEYNGELVGFSFGLLDYNQIFIKFRQGKITLPGILHFIKHRKKMNYIRIMLLGVVKKHRNIGIEGIFFSNFIKVARTNKLRGGEASWVLESNEMMVKAAEKLNGIKYKTYRMYTKKV